MKEKDMVKEKLDDLGYKLQEEYCRLKLVGKFLNSVVDIDGDTEIWGAQLVVEEVAKNIMHYREEFLGC